MVYRQVETTPTHGLSGEVFLEKFRCNWSAVLNECSYGLLERLQDL